MNLPKTMGISYKPNNGEREIMTHVCFYNLESYPKKMWYICKLPGTFLIWTWGLIAVVSSFI